MSDVDARVVPENLWLAVRPVLAEFYVMCAQTSRLVDVSSNDVLLKDERLEVNPIGRIDEKSLKNTRLLMAKLVMDLDKHDAENAMNLLGRTVVSRHLKRDLVTLPGGAERLISWGIDGPTLFGKYTVELVTYLQGMQDLWAGTFWMPVDYGVSWLRTESANLKKSMAAVAWVDRLQKCGQEKDGV